MSDKQKTLLLGIILLLSLGLLWVANYANGDLLVR